MEILHSLAQDTEWRRRSLALKAIGEVRFKVSIPFLIERLAVERLRLRHDVLRVLRLLTRSAMGLDVEKWREWWREYGDAFQVSPPLAEYDEALARSPADDAQSFYGIPIESDHFVFVIDVSGSMKDPPLGRSQSEITRLDVAKREITKILRRPPPESRVNLLFFEKRVHRWRRRVVKLNERLTDQALQYAQGRMADGGTNLFGGLSTAFKDDEADTVYLLTDGEPTEGDPKEPAAIRDAIQQLDPSGQMVVHCVSIGTRSRLLQWLASDWNGQYVER